MQKKKRKKKIILIGSTCEWNQNIPKVVSHAIFFAMLKFEGEGAGRNETGKNCIVRNAAGLFTARNLKGNSSEFESIRIFPFSDGTDSPVTARVAQFG